MMWACDGGYKLSLGVNHVAIKRRDCVTGSAGLIDLGLIGLGVSSDMRVGTARDTVSNHVQNKG